MQTIRWLDGEGQELTNNMGQQQLALTIVGVREELNNTIYMCEVTALLADIPNTLTEDIIFIVRGKYVPSYRVKPSLVFMHAMMDCWSGYSGAWVCSIMFALPSHDKSYLASFYMHEPSFNGWPSSQTSSVIDEQLHHYLKCHYPVDSIGVFQS